MKTLNHLGAVLRPCNDIHVIRSWLLSLYILRDLVFKQNSYIYIYTDVKFSGEGYLIGAAVQ